MNREKVIKGMEQFRADFKPFFGNHADWERFDAGLSMLKEQEEREQRICKSICNFIRCACSTDTDDDKDFILFLRNFGHTT